MIANLIQTAMTSSINKSQLGGQKDMSDSNLLVLLISLTMKCSQDLLV